jgi:hypothetical protein
MNLKAILLDSLGDFRGGLSEVSKETAFVEFLDKDVLVSKESVELWDEVLEAGGFEDYWDVSILLVVGDLLGVVYGDDFSVDCFVSFENNRGLKAAVEGLLRYTNRIGSESSDDDF